MAQKAPIDVTLISDATGSLGEHVLQAIFTQFPIDAFRLKVIPFVNSQKALKLCLKRLEEQRGGLVVHATIYKSFKHRIEEVCRRRGLFVYDLTGPIMSFVATASGRRPQIRYDKLHDLSPDYFRRMDAIQYAVEHDDGGGLHTLNEAEVVLTGVSRTTKTPTSMVLAMLHGLRVANVPIVSGLPPPHELLDFDPKRVICLMMRPSRLAIVRAGRARHELAFDGGYADEHHIQEELLEARRICASRGWREIDVTGRAVEETAARIVELTSGR